MLPQNVNITGNGKAFSHFFSCNASGLGLFWFPSRAQCEHKWILSSLLLLLWGIVLLSFFKKNHTLVEGIQKKKYPPTKRTRTWGARAEEKLLRLKFRNEKWLFLLSSCSLMWHCDQYQMLGGKDFCQAFCVKIDLTYQLLFVDLTMCVTIKSCHCYIVNTWIVAILYSCIAFCRFPVCKVWLQLHREKNLLGEQHSFSKPVQLVNMQKAGEKRQIKYG